MHLKNTLLMSSILLLSFCSKAGAGQKLYSFDGFLRESQDRLERLKVTRGKLPVYRVPKAIVANPLNPSTRNTTKSIISEFIGGAWIHDPGENNKESDSWNFNTQIVFTKIRLFKFSNRFLRFPAEPRPLIGGSVNGEGKTHTVYGGLSWAHQFRNGQFFNLSLGGTYHTGNLEQATRQCSAGEGCVLPGNRAYVNTREPTLGSAVLFREALDLGYRIGPHGLSLFMSHISNAGLDNDNDGMNFVGMRYSFAIDRQFRN